jgi:murein DD-endopeptidase MepM/ murein hydrolase activator NlpD
LFILAALPVYLLVSLYYIDKETFICPIKYKGNMVIRNDSRGSGYFGAERNGGRLHQGLDLFAPVGSDVMAVRSGRVIAAQQNRGMGKFVAIKHADGIRTIYGHLAQIYVRRFSFVRQGQVIGAVGKTGNANYRDIQPHLHFELKKDGVPQDPLEYLN